MTEDDARKLAAKREAHKPKSMTHKRWVAQHDSVKGWHAALVDNHLEIERQKKFNAFAEARAALMRGDVRGLLDAASDHLLASVRLELAQDEDRRQNGKTN